MLSIDRDAALSVHDQLVAQLRFQIVSGRYAVDETLPSTRVLAGQLDISFHTVRKAYQTLEAEGLLEARVGSGYRVCERTPLAKTDRMEQGASVVHDALKQLIGLGLAEDEIEVLFAEQNELFEAPHQGPRLVYAGRYLEEAEACAAQLARSLQQRVEAASLHHLDAYVDADVVFGRFADRDRLLGQVAGADVVSVISYPAPDVLEHMARLTSKQTLGLVTRHPDAVQPITQDLRYWSHFDGQIIASTIEGGNAQLTAFLQQTDLLLFTPGCRRRLYAHKEHMPASTELTPIISSHSLDRLRARLPV